VCVCMCVCVKTGFAVLESLKYQERASICALKHSMTLHATARAV
jgi:hypothetical protein